MSEFDGRLPRGHEHLDVANAQWPAEYKTAPNRDPIAVQVWLDFQPRGWITGMKHIPEWVDGDAVAWTSTHVGVRTGDERVCWDVVWVRAEHVRRR